VDRGGGIWLRQGQEVNVGQRIGRVGMTGRTTGPHLHWTLKYQGKLVDPGAVLRRMQQAQASGRTLSLRP
jgi:murein DD-endopeptidase MepM/ murein hydrolase activator NlpD